MLSSRGEGRGSVRPVPMLGKVFHSTLFRVAFFKPNMLEPIYGVKRNLPHAPTLRTRKGMDSVPLVFHFLLVFFIYFILSTYFFGLRVRSLSLSLSLSLSTGLYVALSSIPPCNR